MICYIYDDSFEGLLTAVYEAYYNVNKPEEITPEREFCHSLITYPVYIETDLDKYNKVCNAMKNKISINFIRCVFYVFLSELPRSSSLIYEYIKLGFKIGKDVDLHLNNNIVLAVHKIVKKVIIEYHKMLGFVRFKNIENEVFYADIKPDHNITILITPHFVKRFSSQKFIIHDLKREIAAIYNGEQWQIVFLTKELAINYKDKRQDDLYEMLWKDYFKSASIENRKNSRLQKSWMPKRYWEFLTELN